MSFTGIKDLDYKIMEELDIKSLLNFCRTDKYISQLCENDMFWKRRFEQRIGNGIFKPVEMTWKRYYLDLLSNEHNNPQGDVIREPLINILLNANFGNNTNEIREALKLPLKNKMLNRDIMVMLGSIGAIFNKDDFERSTDKNLSAGFDLLKKNGVDTEKLSINTGGFLYGLYAIRNPSSLSEREILASAENRIMLNNTKQILAQIRRRELLPRV
jgi:hypothetical protein